MHLYEKCFLKSAKSTKSLTVGQYFIVFCHARQQFKCLLIITFRSLIKSVMLFEIGKYF